MLTILLQQIVNGLILGSIYILVSAGLSLIMGILRLINLAHGELYMFGAYAAFAFMGLTGLGFFPAMIAALAVVSVLSFFVEKLVFAPLRGGQLLAQLMASLGLSMVLQNVALIIWKADPRKLTAPFSHIYLSLGGVSFTGQRLLVVVASFCLILILHWVLKNTWIGLETRALAQDNIAGRLVGANINRTISFVFIVAGALAAIAGVLVGPIFVLQPSMGAMVGLKAFIIVAIGGRGSVTGTIYGGLLLGIFESLAEAFIFSGYKDIIAFLALVIVLMVKPEGLLRES